MELGLDNNNGPRLSSARRCRWQLALGLVALTVVTRLPAVLHPHPIDDENVYAVVATEMLQGGQPYVDAVERKPPLLFWTYKSILSVTGPNNWIGFHIAGLLWTLAIVAGIFWIGRSVFDERAGFAAAFLVSIFLAWAYWKNLALNGEILMNLPIVLGTAIIIRKNAAPLRLDLVAAGVLLCAAFLLKQPAAIAAIPLGIYLLLPRYRLERNLKPAHSILHGALFTIGFFGSLGVVALWLNRLGILADAYYWTVGDHDVPHGPTDPIFWIRGARTTVLFTVTCAPLVLLATLSIRDGLRSKSSLWTGHSAEFTLFVLLLLASIVAVATPGRFYPHYYIQLVPWLAVLAAPFAARFVPPVTITRRYECLMNPWLVLTTVGFLVAHSVGLPSSSPDSEGIAYMRQHSEEGDRLFVWGHSPHVYLESGLRPASRYIMTFPLTGYIFGSPLTHDPDHDTSDRILPGAWENLRKDFAKHPPTFIYDDEAVRTPPKYTVDRFPILASILHSQYELALETSDGLVYRLRE
jgi:4-amino-4-deoxy-L-arabinose transferase-like glycosyltransferase